MNLWIPIAAVLSLVFVAWQAEKGFAAPAVADGAVRTQMRNVTYRFRENVSVRIVELAGARKVTCS
jgi:hypothetical protein